jgi:hypothetical protein
MLLHLPNVLITFTILFFMIFQDGNSFHACYSMIFERENVP